jgi:pimeloyl-ACP methyl ester carboxylesterase
MSAPSKKYETQPSSPTPPLENDAYLGTYTNDYFGNIEIVEYDNALAVVQGPQNMRFAMKHFDRDIFTYLPTGESSPGTSGIFFTIGADGKAMQVRIENLDEAGNGTFTRVAGTASESGMTQPTAVEGNFAGLVDIGNGRRLYLECEGSGSPTVILEAGLRNRGDVWSVNPEEGTERTMVMPGVAKFTRVCAYDRPGTTLGADLYSRSDAVAMPRVAQDAVGDLQALFMAAKIPGPYVLVGHSTGGLIQRLFASEYPDVVVGMVQVDALTEDLSKNMTPENYATFIRLNTDIPPGFEGYNDLEVIEFEPSFEAMRAANALPEVPFFVLTRGIPTTDFPSGVSADFAKEFEQAWQSEQNRLVSLEPNSKHEIAGKSGHYIMVQQPELVIDAIQQVVNAVREPESWQ